MSLLRPDGALDARFDLFYNQRWNEIPNEDTRSSLATDGGVAITRGRPNETGETQPTTCALSLSNTDGKYSLRNPFSPLFGLISRNTPLRVRLAGPEFEQVPTASVRSVVSYHENINIHTIPAPAGLQPGDVLLAFLAALSGSLANMGPPQGGAEWIELSAVESNDPSILDSGGFPIFPGFGKCFWKIAGPAEPATYRVDLDTFLLANVVAVQGAGHARPNIINFAETPFSTTVTSKSSLPGVSNLELRWAVGHSEPIGPDPAWTAPVGFVQHTAADFGNSDNTGCLASRQLSTLNETGDHEFTSTVEVANRLSFTVNVYSQDVSAIRAVTEVSAWPPRWTPSSINAPVELGAGDVWVPIEGGGISRRLGQGVKPLRSAMHRVHMSRADVVFADDGLGALIGYWPLEEGEDATVGASPLVGVDDATFVGNVQLGAEAPSGGTAQLVRVEDDTGKIRMNVPAFPVDWIIQRSWLIGFEFAHEPTATGSMLELRFIEQHWRWRVIASFNVALNILDWDILRADLNDDPPVDVLEDSGESDVAPFYFVEVRKFTNTFQVFVNGVSIMSGSVPALDQIGPPTSLELGTSAGSDEAVVIGHVSVWAIGNTPQSAALPDILSAVDGYRGEPAGKRVERLCSEENIPFYGVGDLDNTALMGTQPIDELLSILRESEFVDLGFLYEPREQLGFVYRTRESLYAQAADLALTPGARGEVIQPLDPVDDDRLIRNDVTVTRPGGSSARVVQESGPLSTQSPPAGAGVYDVNDQVNVQSDLDLPNQAGFRLLLGTIDEARYPTMTFDVFALFEFDKLELLRQLLRLDVGDRFTVDDPPVWLPNEFIDQLALGFSEALTERSWDITTNNAPSKPFLQIADFADEEETPAPDAPGRYDTADTRTLEDFEVGVDTVLRQETVVGQLWTTNNGGVLIRAQGDFAQTPDDAILDITGDVDLRADVSLASWFNTQRTAVSKYDVVINQRSYALTILASGLLRLNWSTDGTAISAADSTVTVPTLSGRMAIRTTLDVDNGAAQHVVTFYTASSLLGPWTQLGAQVVNAGVTSIHSGTAPLTAGAFADSGNPFIGGIIHAAEVRSGINGIAVANPDFTQRAGQTSFTDDAGRPWTLDGDAVLVNGDLPLDINLEGAQLRVINITYNQPVLVDVTSVASGTTGSFTVPAPAGIQEGDVLVAFHSTDVGTLTLGTIRGGTPWTLIGSVQPEDATGRVHVRAKVAGSAEPSEYTVTQNAGADGVIAVAAVRNGRILTLPPAAIQAHIGADTAMPTPGTQPLAQNLELRWVSAESNVTFAPPTGFTEQADVVSGTFVAGSLATRVAPALQTGTHNFTASASAVDRIGVTVNIIGTQMMTTQQEPLNAHPGATKVVPAGQQLSLWAPTRYAL